MANTTTRRGRGFAPKAIRVSAADGEALRRLLWERHRLSAEEAFASILCGETRTVLLADEQRDMLIAFLRSAPDTPQGLREAAESLIAQL